MKTNLHTKPAIASVLSSLKSHKLLVALQMSLTQFLCPSNSASACSSTCAYTSCFVKPSANEDASA